MEKPKKRMNKGTTVAIVIGSVLLFIAAWGAILSIVISNVAGTGFETEFGYESIDVVYVNGVIGEESSFFSEASYNHNWTIEQINRLMDSESNRAILLYVNSPGGGVYESDELYLKLKEYKEITGRPVYAYMAQMAASGGYYVSMAADKVFANRMTMTGSIGVIMSMMDTTVLEEKIGVKTDNIVSGKNKAMGNPLTDEQRKILQDMVDESYGIFVNIVAENRGLDLETTKKLADGRIYTANQAKELKLIDEVGNFESTVEDLRINYGLEDCEVYDVINEQTFWDSFLAKVGKNVRFLNEFDSIKEYIYKNDSGKLMYYYKR
ncbi:MAG: signal peptide peptidase SppA, type [Clostridia bacterium]|jgi:protease-4|nr:signal peptide peptidase SppA, type [Clostridia bacterium]